MIGVISKGTRHTETSKYDLGEIDKTKIVKVLGFEGVDMPHDCQGLIAPNASRIARSMEVQSSLNPSVELKVIHIALSFDEKDNEILSDQFLQAIALEYMHRMGYIDTQYVITRHMEKNNPHIHIAINAINNRGERIDTYNDYRRNVKVCKDLTQKYNLTIGYWKGFDRTEIPANSPSRLKAIGQQIISREVWRALIDTTQIEELPLKLLAGGSTVSAQLDRDASGNVVRVTFAVNVDMETGGKKRYTFTDGKADKRLSAQNIRRVLDIKKDLPCFMNDVKKALSINPATMDISKEDEKTISSLHEIYSSPWVCVESRQNCLIPLLLELALHMKELTHLFEFLRHPIKKKQTLQTNHEEIQVTTKQEVSNEEALSTGRNRGI